MCEAKDQQPIQQTNLLNGSHSGLNMTPEEHRKMVMSVVPQEILQDEKTAEYVRRVADEYTSVSIAPIEQYVNNKTKIKHKCFICGAVVEVAPGNVQSAARAGKRNCSGCNHKMGKTLEEAQEVFKKRNPRVIPLEGYQRQSDKIKVKCAECGRVWTVSVSSAFEGGCKVCGDARGALKRTSKKKPPEQFAAEAKQRNPHVEVLDTYIDNRTKLKVRCVYCGAIEYKMPSKILVGQGHKPCRVGKFRNHEDYLKELAELGIDGYEPLEEYCGEENKILHRCKECGNEWKVAPSNIKKGYGCPFCAGRLGNVSYDDFVKMIQQVDPDIMPMENFKGKNTKTQFKCLKCENIFYALPYDIFNSHAEAIGTGCPSCVRQGPKRTIDELNELLEEQHSQMRCIGDYEGKYGKFKCTKCGAERRALVANIIRGIGCPKCSFSGTSIPELALAYYLKRDTNYTVKHNPQITLADGFHFNADIFIPELSIFIEYDGIWHKYENVQKRDREREEHIYENGYKCLHIIELTDSVVERAWLREQPFWVDPKQGYTLRNFASQIAAFSSLYSVLGIKAKEPFDIATDLVNIAEMFYEEEKEKISLE